MIRPGRVIASRLGRVGPDEHGPRDERSSCDRLAIDNQMLGRDAIRKQHGFLQRARHNRAAVSGQRAPGDLAVEGAPSDCTGHSLGQRALPGDENRPGIRVVLGLCHQIRGNPFRPAASGEDDDLGRTGIEVDRAILGHVRFGRRDVLVARTHDLVDARHRCRAVRQGRNGVGTADSKEPRDPRFQRRGHHSGLGSRTDRDDVGDARHAGGDGRHQKR